MSRPAPDPSDPAAPAAPSTAPPVVVVVGTGRTGSTLLSSIFSEHPGILSLSEFFTSLGGLPALTDRTMTGAEYWSMLADPHPGFTAMLRHGVTLPEFAYLRVPRRRHSTEEGIPALSLMTLPHLTGDPDAALDSLADRVRSAGEQRLADHHRALFRTLRTIFGGSVVVERSGHSLSWVGVLRTMLPEARFVHMHRDGPDCALSMSRHAGYRTAALVDEIVRLSGVSTPAEIGDEELDRLPPDLAQLWRDDFLTAFRLDRTIPLDRYGAIWSSMIEDGMALLDRVPPDRWTSLAYESLVDSPATELERIASFVGVRTTPEWLARADEMVDRSRTGAVGRLPVAERNALADACARGRELVGGVR